MITDSILFIIAFFLLVHREFVRIWFIQYDIYDNNILKFFIRELKVVKYCPLLPTVWLKS